MTTYGIMQARIQDEIDDATDAQFTTQIQRAIQSAIKFYERIPFYFNSSTTATFSLVANQEYYDSSDESHIPDLVQINSLYWSYDDGSREYLSVATSSQIDMSQTGTTVADPTHFAYEAQQIRMYPIPSQTRTVTADWVYRFTALSAAGDTNAWMTDGEELIRLHAKMILARDVTGDDNEVQRLAPWILIAKQALVDETRRRRSSPRLRSAFPMQRRFNINTGY